MNKTLVYLLLFVASAMAKGRSGGGRSSGGSSVIDDNWDAPAETKVAMAFEIIWFTISLVQLTYIFKYLKGIPSMAARGPYIMLAFVTLCFGVYYLLAAILTRAENLAFSDSNALNSAAAFFLNTNAAFKPAVVLYIIHVRGDILRAVKGNTTSPLSTQIWKRILDWVLTGLAFVMLTAAMGVSATQLAEFGNGNYNYDQLEQLYQASLGLSQTGIAFVILLIIILVVSVIVQFIQGKGTPTSDLVTRRLLMMAVPLFVLYAVELLFFDIFTLTGPVTYDPLALNLASVIVDGVIEISITAVLILTMTLPGVQWTPQTVAPETSGIPGKQWGTPNSGWNQPYPNAGWNQPGYNPQQPPQQQPFYPQSDPMSQQMQQQQQYSSSPPTHPVPN